MQSLKNKLICITGATSGIGEACAISCAAAGAKLLLIGRRTDKLQALQAQLQATSAAIHTISLDVRDAASVASFVQDLPADWQNIEILINNAGLAVGLDTIADADINDWDRMIDTNVKGLLYMSKALLPNMLKQNQGQIINIGSISGHLSYAGGSVYCASKHAVLAINKALRQEVLGKNIRVNLISPGAVETEFSNVRFKGDDDKANAAYQGFQPLFAHDVAETVLFCLTRPAHVNLDEIIVMPTAQADLNIHRE
jgi:NADP-dependent 3-hydroxy acid dehydrogenase YdfG